MSKKTKQLLAKLLVLCMIVGLLPMAALGLSGTAYADDPYGGGQTADVTGTTASVDAVMRGNTATASLSSSDVSKAVENAATAGSDVAIDIDTQNATDLEVTLPVSALSKLTKGLTITSGVADIALDNALVKALGTTGNAVVKAETVAESALTAAQKKAAGTGKVFDFSITVGGRQVDFKDGKVSVSVGLPTGVSAAKAVVWYMDDAGKMSSCETSVKNGKVTFKTNHFSKYVVAELPFADLAVNAWYLDAVKWGTDEGIIKGMSATTFEPSTKCNREQVVTFLWRLEGEPKPTTTTNPFTDVKEGDFAYDAILWAVEKGIAKGKTDTTFEPKTDCTRAEALTFLYRYEKEPTAASSSKFTDVVAGQWYAAAVDWAVSKDIAKGLEGGTTFGVDSLCERSQIAAFLYRDQVK